MSLPLYLLAGLAALVYVWSGGVLVRLLFGRLRWRRGGEGPARRGGAFFLDAAMLSLGGLGLLAVGYSHYEPYWPEVTRQRVESDRLPAGSRPIRVVQLSDLHSEGTVRLERRLPEIVAGLKPDLVVFTGDAINSEDGLATFRQLMTELARLAPTFAVAGNWETWWFPGVDLYGGTGVRRLEGEAVRLVVEGTELWIAGVGVDQDDRIDQALAQVPPGRFILFLHHYPEIVERVAGRVDLHCAGDTHGGQVRLPVHGALIRMKRFGRYLDQGLHRFGRTWLYVHRGVGLEGGNAPRVRFLCRPEVALIELAPAAAALSP